jgi:uncharacterized membrane protein YhhN
MSRRLVSDIGRALRWLLSLARADFNLFRLVVVGILAALGLLFVIVRLLIYGLEPGMLRYIVVALGVMAATAGMFALTNPFRKK